jgi:hypothetical protein
MISISRSILLAASLLAVPLAGAVAQSDTGKSTGPSSAAGGDNKMGGASGDKAMKSTTQGDAGKSTGPSAATGGDSKMGGAAMKRTMPDDKPGAAMKSASPGYETKSDVSGAVGKSPGNAATGQSGKQSQ